MRRPLCPVSRCETTVALCADPATVWPTMVRRHSGPSNVDSNHPRGLLCATYHACEFGVRPFSAADQLAAATTTQQAPDRRGEQQSGVASHHSFTDPIVHRPHVCATTAALRWRLLRGCGWHPGGWHPGIDDATTGGGTLPPSVSVRTAPHLQAAIASRPSNLAVTHGEEGNCVC
jgi:hypothetical protein